MADTFYTEVGGKKLMDTHSGRFPNKVLRKEKCTCKGGMPGLKMVESGGAGYTTRCQCGAETVYQRGATTPAQDARDRIARAKAKTSKKRTDPLSWLLG